MDLQKTITGRSIPSNSTTSRPSAEDIELVLGRGGGTMLTESSFAAPESARTDLAWIFVGSLATSRQQNGMPIAWPSALSLLRMILSTRSSQSRTSSLLLVL